MDRDSPENEKKQTSLRLWLLGGISILILSTLWMLRSTELTLTPLWIEADRQQLEQVIINVVKNALESIDKQGTITFKTIHLPAQLAIIDSGSGIAPLIADQLFSPFFSTKKNGQGVGLTLVREILVNHGFGLSLKTEASKKTVFRVWF